jgi:hypothetical protein
MADAFEELLGSDVLSEDVKSALSEAWEKKVSESQDKIKAELREEFGQRYENDKGQIIEAMDKMLNDSIKTEVEEFVSDRQNLANATVGYKKNIKEHAEILDKFLLEELKKEITELRGDRTNQSNNFKKLEGFVIKQLTKELNEFHTDKKSVVEQKVRLVKEGKQLIANAKKDFVKKAAEKVEKVVESAVQGELTALRDDIKSARENNFGRKIFETFAAEFMTSYLAEGTQLRKYGNKISELEKQIEETNKSLTDSKVQIAESERKANIAEDLANRQKQMSELLDPLAKDKKEIMEDLLESVKTDNLGKAFQKYLPAVINEKVIKKTEKSEKKSLTESKKTTPAKKSVRTGNKTFPIHIGNETPDAEKEIGNLRKLAGLDN